MEVEKKKSKELSKEIRIKDKALAETTALLGQEQNGVLVAIKHGSQVNYRDVNYS
ncbi:hypothetical protein [Clostridium sp.]|uniref:hypothetical protein n=1 Tax=Clostridium sp. TaxID=1506 RepID=UPI0032167C92